MEVFTPKLPAAFPADIGTLIPGRYLKEAACVTQRIYCVPTSRVGFFCLSSMTRPFLYRFTSSRKAIPPQIINLDTIWKTPRF